MFPATHLIIFICLLGLSLISFSQNVGIGTDTPDASAKLDVTSTNSGVLVPRVTSIQRTTIASPANGLLVYDTNTNSFWFYQSSTWVELVANGTLEDTDGDTKIQVEESVDEDRIRFDVAGSEAMMIDNNGEVGIGNSAPDANLHVTGSILMEGDFINQEVVGAHSGTFQSIPFNNGVFNPLTGTTVSITITDGSGVNNSAVFLSGFARIFGGNLTGSNSSLGGFFLILQRDTDPAFSSSVILTYTAGSCYIETPNGASSQILTFGDGPHVSYVDSGLNPGTYYYRLVLYPNSIGITNGSFDVYQRDLNLLQIKR
ncbi:MAG: hypothetical protein RIC06_01015 [Cyclobacteriaceae bacterium]